MESKTSLTCDVRIKVAAICYRTLWRSWLRQFASHRKVAGRVLTEKFHESLVAVIFLGGFYKYTKALLESAKFSLRTSQAQRILVYLNTGTKFCS